MKDFVSNFWRILGWIMVGAGVYNVLLGIFKYDMEPVSLVAGVVMALLGVAVLRWKGRRE